MIVLDEVKKSGQKAFRPDFNLLTQKYMGEVGYDYMVDDADLI